MKKSLAIVSVLLLLPGAVLAQSSPFAGYVPDRLVVTVREGVDLQPAKSAAGVRVGVAGLDALNARFAVRDVAPLYAGMTNRLAGKADVGVLERVFAVDLPAGADLQRARRAYESLPEVEEVRLVEIYRPAAFLPNDPNLASQWHLRNMNVGGGDVRAVGGWNQSLGDTNVVVAIIDSGLDWHHPDLGGTHPDRVNGAVWTNWTEYHGSPGVDDDGNGFIDDIRGWDFVNTSQSFGYPDEDMTVPDNDPMDYESHGTAVAGCVAAITNNGVGVAGVAPGCKLMALRAGYLPAGETGGILRSDWISQAMIYAANNGADIVNGSWTSSSFLQNAVNTCQAAGILIVSAAGNEDTNDSSSYFLGTQPGVVAVAATDPNDAKASFSNYGTWVEVSAPGTAIHTTWYDRITGTSTYSTVQGTSFASPIAAGVAAMILSANPSLTYLQLITELENSCDPIDDVNPAYAGQLGAGRVNVLKALGDDMQRFPEEFPTLFDAMNEAAAGDTVGVLAGEAITGPLMVLPGVKLFGGYSVDYAGRDPLGDPAVITSSANDPGMRFFAGDHAATEVDGFLIQGGGGTNFSGIPYNGDFGGGIVINGVSPTLRNLTVTGNGVGGTDTFGGGGGIMLNGSSATLENVTISGNAAIYGGGIYMNNSAPTLIGCTVQANSVITDNFSYTPAGGGIYGVDSDLTLIDCTVADHTGCDLGGGIHMTGNSGVSNLTMDGGTVRGNDANTRGGGVYHSTGAVDLNGVVFEANGKGVAPNFMSGGGFYGTGCTVTADSLICTANTAQLGSALTFENCASADLTNSVLHGNTADFYGALVVQGVTASTVAGNTIAANAAPAAGGGVYTASSTVAFDHNIVALNTGGPTFANGVHVVSGTLTPSCNDVWGNDNADWAGIADPTGTSGNVSADPHLCDPAGGDFSLGTASPCDPDNSGGCGLIGAVGETCGLSAVPGEDGTVPTAFRVDQNFPNPFNPVTTIRFSLPASARTEVAIYDVKGRRVRTLVDDVLEAKMHEVDWRGRDDRGRAVAAGVYFYLVTSGEHRAAGRMALVK